MEEIIKIFNDNNVRYLLMGGQALRLLGMPRFTMDWDFMIPKRDTANIEKINRLLAGILDFPLEDIGEKGENFIQTYQTPFGIIQFHLLALGFKTFEEAEENKIVLNLSGNLQANCLSPKYLLKEKKAVCRGKDTDDILFLENLP
jgi:hypothetical protein